MHLEHAPHCPNCHAAWFRTVSRLDIPFEQWVRQCKLCGHEFKPAEALIFRLERVGEREGT